MIGVGWLCVMCLVVGVGIGVTWVIVLSHSLWTGMMKGRFMIRHGRRRYSVLGLRQVVHRVLGGMTNRTV